MFSFRQFALSKCLVWLSLQFLLMQAEFRVAFAGFLTMGRTNPAQYHQRKRSQMKFNWSTWSGCHSKSDGSLFILAVESRAEKCMWYYTLQNISAAEMYISSNLHFPDQEMNWERKEKLRKKTFPFWKGTPTLQTSGEGWWKGRGCGFKGEKIQGASLQLRPECSDPNKYSLFWPQNPIVCQWICWPSFSVNLSLFSCLSEHRDPRSECCW